MSSNKNDFKQNNNAVGFVENTLVRLPETWKKIQDIQIGDVILSPAENGKGVPVAKKVINTFCFTNKPVWSISFGTLDQVGAILPVTEQVVTSNSLYCVYGYLQQHDLITYEKRNPILFDEPIWKTVAQIETGDLVKNGQDRYLCALFILPLYKTSQEGVVWLPGTSILEKHLDRLSNQYQWWRYTEEGEPYKFNEKGRLERVWSLESNDDMIINIISRPEVFETAHEFVFEPYIATVYTFEAEDYHTYLVSHQGILVKDLVINKK